MAGSVVEICNNALQGLKANRIMNLGDGSDEADKCNQIWPSVRDSVLASHPWHCAMTLVQLQQSSITPAWKWSYSYPLPADCLRVFELVDSSETTILDWEINGREIFCNADAPVYIAYVRREEDPAKYDALLCKALSAAMAADLAFPISAGVTAMQAAQTLYQNALREARGVNARQGSTTSDPNTGSWYFAKLGGRNLG